ncbi:MAG: hypothetical protein MUF48_15875 [Pirellulaceae bacterium]|jgi:hypothetical protein|nr:hypothetical protein [Pirellulaceae bacterium]
MFRRLSSYILLVVLAGAVIDGGTVGFRSAWASCGDWLADHGSSSRPAQGISAGEPLPILVLHFGSLFLRDDETAESTAHHAAPATGRCHPLDPTCRMLPQQPATPMPVPPTWDVERLDCWLEGMHSLAFLHGSLVVEGAATWPFFRPSDIFRPPRDENAA